VPACLRSLSFVLGIKSNFRGGGLGQGRPMQNMITNGRRTMNDPTPNLADETPIETVRFSTIVRNALLIAGFKTVGEVRVTADEDLRRKRCIGPARLAYLRSTLGANKAKGK
jgi:hypothetical protein